MAGSALLASALTLGIHASDHAHSISLLADEGHLDLVLSHAENGAGHDHSGAPYHENRPTSFSDHDHVLHIAGDDAANATSRRAAVDHVLAPAMAVAVPFAPVPAAAFRPSPEPRARSSGDLSTVVLRL